MNNQSEPKCDCTKIDESKGRGHLDEAFTPEKIEKVRLDRGRTLGTRIEHFSTLWVLLKDLSKLEIVLKTYGIFYIILGLTWGPFRSISLGSREKLGFSLRKLGKKGTKCSSKMKKIVTQIFLEATNGTKLKSKQHSLKVWKPLSMMSYFTFEGSKTANNKTHYCQKGEKLCQPTILPCPGLTRPTSALETTQSTPGHCRRLRPISMRLRTNTGLISKGGAGGLLLDTGSGPSFLPLPTPVLEQVAAGNSEPGVTTLKLPDTFQRPHDYSVRDIDVEVCFVCKKCRLAFPGESPLLTHQRQCYGGNQESRGAFRIVQTGYECKSCNNERFKSFLDLKKHCESDLHLKASSCGTIINSKLASLLPPPSESPLSHEMEDVVNQITLLAARAAQESPQQAVDSNSNSFCPPADPKRRFLTPNDVAPPLTTGH
ncbi:uncharacterized protein LOC130445862 [Diorhabda sublineata]|uniref:uncharacterized protein LOC130445862 n=1 Tax=Diorhabda sublineata TaxID=1163346 RepID=UPI0024E0D01C|nr:uncharacterized protein LOC130445862 [Diorhabda sublineata]